jgi:hypothetical protein
MLNQAGDWVDFNQKKLPATKNIECDHILPAAAGLIYYDVISEGNLLKSEADFLSKNYGWAHPTCNNKKSDRLFFKIANEKGFLTEYGGIFDNSINEYIVKDLGLNVNSNDYKRANESIRKNLENLDDYFSGSVESEGKKQKVDYAPGIHILGSIEILKKNIDFLYSKLMFEKDPVYRKKISSLLEKDLTKQRTLSREIYNDYVFLVESEDVVKGRENLIQSKLDRRLQFIKDWPDADITPSEQKMLEEEQINKDDAMKGLTMVGETPPVAPTPGSKRARGSGKTKRRKGGKKRTKRIHKNRK